jgi:hypothetical protein
LKSWEEGAKKKKGLLARRATVVSDTKKKVLEKGGGQVSGDTLSTDGIDIETLQLFTKDKEKDKDKTSGSNKSITFSCWDFGGTRASQISPKRGFPVGIVFFLLDSFLSPPHAYFSSAHAPVSPP